MSIAAGTRIGPYEVVGPIGAGGMGEVYRAHDTRLNRDVAIRVLPEAFASDAGVCEDPEPDTCDITPEEPAVPKPLQTYEGQDITVTFDPAICVHSAVCVRGMPAVFDVSRARWIDVNADTADAIAAQVARCPSGALQVTRRAG
jgi:uncharacterized Fe-S cluster protein YjdI